MADVSSPAIDPHSLHSIQRSDTSGENQAEQGQTDHVLVNREGSAKDLASSGQDGTSSTSFYPISIKECKNACEGALSTETALNPVPEENGNQTVIADTCTEVENKGNTIQLESCALPKEPSQPFKLKPDSILEKHLEVKGVTETPSLVVSSVSEHNIEKDLLENELELNERIEMEDQSANGPSFHSSKSSAELPFACNGTKEAVDNSSSHDQGHRDANDFRLIEKPLNFAEGTDDPEVSSSVDKSNMIRTRLQSENFGDVKISENSKIRETSPAETPMNTELGKQMCAKRDKSNASEKGTERLGTVVNESEFSDLHDDEFLENERKEFGSRLESFCSRSDGEDHPVMDESCLESRPDSNTDKFEDLHCHENIEERRPSTISEESFSSSNWGWLDEVSPSSNPVTALVSHDMEGWHRFDVEEENANNEVYGGGVQSQVSHQPELWEQLLEDGEEAVLEANENEEKVSSVILSGIESPAGDQNYQTGVASPGNPFLENLDRLSNFSEAEGFLFNETLARSYFSPSVKTAASRCAEEDSTSTPFEKGEILSVADHDFAATIGNQETNGPEVETVDTSASRLVAPCDSESQPKTNHQPLVGNSGSSSVSMELFDAPSFMSLVDPETDQLFKASMPTYGAKSSVSSQENGGEKWVANFDLMMPSQPQTSSPQEISRSISLPRVNTGGDSALEVPGSQSQIASPSSKQKQSFSPSGIWKSLSRKSVTPTASPKSRSSVSSPKISPLVKNVVQKLRTTSVVARPVLNTSSNVMSPKTSDTKSKQGPLWSCCACFFS